MPAVAMAFGCNHLFSLACEVDRDATAEELARLDSEDPAERSKCTLLAPAKDRASDAAWYAVKYVVKAIATSQAANVLAALALMDGYLMRCVQLERSGDPAADQRKGWSNLMTCANRMSTSITMGLAMISYRLMGHKTYWASYDVKPMPTHAYTGRALRQAGESTDAIGDGRVETTLVPQDNTLRAVNTLTDYDHRADALEALSPYLYHMFYGRQQQPKAKPKPKGRRASKPANKRRRTGARAAAAAYVDADADSERNASEDEAGQQDDEDAGPPQGTRTFSAYNARMHPMHPTAPTTLPQLRHTQRQPDNPQHACVTQHKVAAPWRTPFATPPPLVHTPVPNLPSGAADSPPATIANTRLPPNAAFREEQ